MMALLCSFLEQVTGCLQSSKDLFLKRAGTFWPSDGIRYLRYATIGNQSVGDVEKRAGCLFYV